MVKTFVSLSSFFFSVLLSTAIMVERTWYKKRILLSPLFAASSGFFKPSLLFSPPPPDSCGQFSWVSQRIPQGSGMNLRHRVLGSSQMGRFPLFPSFTSRDSLSFAKWGYGECLGHYSDSRLPTPHQGSLMVAGHHAAGRRFR